VTVGFFLVDTGTVESSCGLVCAEGLVQSVHATMPGVPAVQLTDERTPAVPGVQAVRRLPTAPMAVLRLAHQAAVTGAWLFVDSDVVIQRDVRDVFHQQFDVALTTRNWPHLKLAAGFSERMPFNVGVVFSRSQAFWRDAEALVRQMPDDLQHWMGDQQAICDLVATGRFTLALLKGTRYNLPPAADADRTPATEKMERKAFIIHYKGVSRKTQMLARLKRDGACA
jgi:hypothetical protein